MSGRQVARQVITSAALGAGWEFKPVAFYTRIGSRFTKGAASIRVDWSSDGRVLYASRQQDADSPVERALARGKREKVLAWLKGEVE